MRSSDLAFESTARWASFALHVVALSFLAAVFGPIFASPVERSELLAATSTLAVLSAMVGGNVLGLVLFALGAERRNRLLVIFVEIALLLVAVVSSSLAFMFVFAAVSLMQVIVLVRSRNGPGAP